METKYIILIAVTFGVVFFLSFVIRKLLTIFIDKNSSHLGVSPTTFVFLKNSSSFVLVTIGIMNPDYPLKFVFLAKPIKLIYIVGGLVLLDLVRLQADIGSERGNAGGWLSHLGGIGFGLLYGSQLLKRKNILKGFERFLESVFSFSYPKTWFKTKPKMKVKQGGKNRKDSVKKDTKSNESRLSAVIEKVKKSGYESLTKAEKEFLFKQGRK